MTNNIINVEAITPMVEQSMQQPAMGQEYNIALSAILPSDRFRCREQENEEAIERYAALFTDFKEALERGENPDYPFPAVWIWQDAAGQYHRVTGFHRSEAAAKAKLPTMLVKEFLGTEDDAFMVAMKDNSEHGLPMTRGDLRLCIKKIASRFPDKSPGVIATMLKRSRSHVSEIISELSATGHVPVVEKRRGRDGKEYSARRKVKQPPEVLLEESDSATLPALQSSDSSNAAPETFESEFQARVKAGEFNGKMWKKNIAKIKAMLGAMEECSPLFQETFELVKRQTEEEELKQLLLAADIRCKSFTKQVAKILAHFSLPSTPNDCQKDSSDDGDADSINENDALLEDASSSEQEVITPAQDEVTPVVDASIPADCSKDSSGIHVLIDYDGKYQAKGRPTDNGFMVLEGSTISQIKVDAMDDRIRTERERLESSGDIKDFTFMVDYPFDSPTKAACFIVGTRVHGCKFWKFPESVKEPATSEQTDSSIDAGDAMEAAVLTSGGKRMTGNVPQTVTLTPPPKA